MILRNCRIIGCIFVMCFFILVANGLTRSLPRFEENVQREDFKLLIDPAIKKGHAKIYRYNGVFPGVRLLLVDKRVVIVCHTVCGTFLNFFVSLPSSNHRLCQRILALGEREYGLSTKPIYQFLILRFAWF